jgi:Mrp family chromosome partitioning ATPase
LREEEQLLTEVIVRKALQGVMDPELHKSLIELGMIRQVRIEGSRVDVTVALTMMGCPLRERIVSDVKAAVGALEGVDGVSVELTEMNDGEKRRIGLGTKKDEEGSAAKFNKVKRVIAVMSGKGGVGKSLVSGLLAISLRRAGKEVGILDADITGPSIPKMFFPEMVRPFTSPFGLVPPESRTGIKVMSINLLLPEEGQAVIWRGPLISSAIKQFWGDMYWGELDYLIVDLPPGTSDASLTVMQSIPISGIVLVSSPQDLAGMVVRKAADMAQQTHTPMLGLIENMSYFECPDTLKRHEIFGPSHAEETAQRIGVSLLGRLPVDPEIARLCDAGRIEDLAAPAFEPIALELLRRIEED